MSFDKYNVDIYKLPRSERRQLISDALRDCNDWGVTRFNFKTDRFDSVIAGIEEVPEMLDVDNYWFRYVIHKGDELELIFQTPMIRNVTIFCIFIKFRCKYVLNWKKEGF